MTEVIGSNPSEHYALISYGNVAAFLIGLGVAVGAALFVRVRAGSFPFDPFRLAVLCILAILAFGNLHQMETERERLWPEKDAPSAPVEDAENPTREES